MIDKITDLKIVKYLSFFFIIVSIINAVIFTINWFSQLSSPITLIQGIFFSTIMTYGAIIVAGFTSLLDPFYMFEEMGILPSYISLSLCFVWLFFVFFITFFGKNELQDDLFFVMFSLSSITNGTFWIYFAWTTNDNYSIISTGLPNKDSQLTFIYWGIGAIVLNIVSLLDATGVLDLNK
ncbi:hypothetical protein JWG39_12350 [Desulforhopalus vacuolatus]|uniref:hypothetical protein n=1 Tax=Desulforhopalus vacuolatus TaxID=40414 RepID=UPI00196632F8|nr:hypothetical protein [Desulforhopalus vacuolatus]MBM9520605.1 hypothetical protein [Desulforhopalus vacuolatus]